MIVGFRCINCHIWKKQYGPIKHKEDPYQKNDFWKIFTKVLLGYGCGASMKCVSKSEH